MNLLSRMTNVRVVSCFFIFLGTAFSQAAGTITAETSTKITVIANSVSCTLTKQTPTSSSGVNFDCLSGGTKVFSGNFLIPVGQTNGNVGSFTVNGDSITWVIKQEVEGTYKWQIAANGFAKEGTF